MDLILFVRVFSLCVGLVSMMVAIDVYGDYIEAIRLYEKEDQKHLYYSWVPDFLKESRMQIKVYSSMSVIAFVVAAISFVLS